MGESYSHQVNGNVADNHRAQPSRDLHTAASPIDAVRDTRPCAGDISRYIDPCTGSHEVSRPHCCHQQTRRYKSSSQQSNPASHYFVSLLLLLDWAHRLITATG